MWWWIAGIGVLVFAWICLWRPVRAMSREVQFAKAKKFFHTQRERLEAKFINLASKRAKPESPRLLGLHFCRRRFLRAQSHNRRTIGAGGHCACHGRSRFHRPQQRRCGGQPAAWHRGVPLRPRSLGDRRPGDSEPQPVRSHSILPQTTWKKWAKNRWRIIRSAESSRAKAINRPVRVRFVPGFYSWSRAI